MNLEDLLRAKVESLGKITWRNMFGRQVALVNGKISAAYRLIDNNLIDVFLILPKEDFERALDSGYFTKFEFGQTWAQAELTQEEELDEIWKYFESSYAFVKQKTK